MGTGSTELGIPAQGVRNPLSRQTTISSPRVIVRFSDLHPGGEATLVPQVLYNPNTIPSTGLGGAPESDKLVVWFTSRVCAVNSDEEIKKNHVLESITGLDTSCMKTVFHVLYNKLVICHMQRCTAHRRNGFHHEIRERIENFEVCPTQGVRLPTAETTR